jgi:hypothetical protein
MPSTDDTMPSYFYIRVPSVVTITSNVVSSDPALVRCTRYNISVCGGKMLKNTKNKSFVYLNYLSVFATKDGTGAIEEEQGYATFNNISVISWRSVLFV